MSSDLRSQFARHFPVVCRSTTVDVIDVEQDGDRVTITARWSESDEGVLIDLREQSFPIERGAPEQTPDRKPVPPTEIDVARLAANVAHHLPRAKWPMPIDLFEPPA